MTTPEGSVALLGDAHLREGDAAVAAFVHFLDALPPAITTLVILGDLFAAWIGRRDLLRPHHASVVEGLRRLRGRGCRLLYVEGNHDFFLAPLYAGDPFDAVARETFDLIILNLELGGTSALPLIPQLREAANKARVLALSALLFYIFAA